MGARGRDSVVRVIQSGGGPIVSDCRTKVSSSVRVGLLGMSFVVV